MSLYISSLNSGSNGNCYYVGNDQEGILVDAGICCREIEKRMQRLGLYIDKVKAIFISHEHSDHIKGLAVLTKKHKLPVYITTSTLRNCSFDLDQDLTYSFNAHEPVIIGNLSITAFPKFHDACDPYSFIIECNKIKAGVFTDIGVPCTHVVKYFKQCHAAFLEANYDDNMLEQGNYPYHLKKRIRGGNGHLSNNQALELFLLHRPPFMSHLLLSHLSQNNNCPKLVSELFTRNANGVKMIVAPRFSETEIFHITSHTAIAAKLPVKQPASQLAFSFK